MEQNLYLCSIVKPVITMDLAKRKYNFIKELTSIDARLLAKLEKVLRANKDPDWFSKLSAAEQSEIETGLKQADDQVLISHQEVMKKFSKWH